MIPRATVEALVETGERTTQDALMFGWWDYGYPIQYFAETDTFVDGGTLFNAPRMFLLSHVLVCADQRDAHAILAAIGTRLSTPEPNLGADELVQRITSGETIERSEPDRDVLLLSNRKLMTILPVVSRFCRANLETGVAPADPLGSYYEDFRDQGSAIAAAYEQFRSTGDRPRLESGGHNIARVIFLDQEDAGAPRRTEWRLRPGGNVLVIRKQEGDALLIDDSLLESAAVQIYFMKNADERLFEILAATKTATVVRLR